MSTERVKTFRQRMKEKQFVRVEGYVHKDDKPKILSYINLLNKKREKL